MNKLNFLSKLCSPLLGSRSSDVSLHCRLTVGSSSGFGSKSLLKLVSILALIFTLGIGSVWGASETFDFSSGTATGSGSSRIITWSGTSCTIVQAKGGSATDVSNSYTGTDLRWYASHDITFTPKSGVTISQITLTGSANDKTGQTMTEQTSTSATISAAGRTTTVSGTWTSSSALTLRMGTQFRLSSVVITYTTGGGSTYSITYVDASGIGTNGRYSASSTSGISSGATITLTATPDDCYQLSSWTAYKTGTPATTVTVTNNQFTMPAYNVTVGATFGAKPAGKTVNFDAGPGVSASSSLTETCSGSGVTLPTVTATGVCKGWTTFAGWATAPVTDSTTTSGVTLYAAGDNFVPASNGQTLYAVYSKSKGGGSGTLTIVPETYTNKGTNAYGSGAERTGTVGTINLGAHYVTGNASGTPGGSTAGQFLQCQGNNANIYNKTALPGKITQVVLNQNSATAFSLYCGTEQLMSSDNTSTGQTPSGTAQTAQSAATQMTWTVSGNYTYFDIKKGSSAGYITSIVITYGSSTTYYCSDPNCCTELGSINGSFF